jgi:hypothetical protein
VSYPAWTDSWTHPTTLTSLPTVVVSHPLVVWPLAGSQPVQTDSGELRSLQMASESKEPPQVQGDGDGKGREGSISEGTRTNTSTTLEPFAPRTCTRHSRRPVTAALNLLS